MYQTIYDVVEKRGRVKTGILLNGEDAGLKLFYPRRAEKIKKQKNFRGSSSGDRFSFSYFNTEEEHCCRG